MGKPAINQWPAVLRCVELPVAIATVAILAEAELDKRLKT